MQGTATELQAELDELREAKMKGELDLHAVSVELKTRTKELSDALALVQRSESQAVSTIKIKLASVEKREKEVRNERANERTNEREGGREGGKHIYCDDALHVRTPA